MEASMPDDLVEAVFNKIDVPGGMKVARGKTFIGNLRREIDIKNVNRRHVHEAVRKLIADGRIKQSLVTEPAEGSRRAMRYVLYVPTNFSKRR